MKLADLRRKPIVLWGAGREGTAFLDRFRTMFPDAPVTVVTDRPLPVEKTDALRDLHPLKFRFGAAVEDALRKAEVVIKSPGVSLYRPEIAAAKAAGVAFTSTTNLAFNEIGVDRIVAVTGTKGKSTTAALISHMLAAAGASAPLCGNIGRPVIEAANRPADVFVTELSSYQIADLTAFPRCRLLTALYPEHVDWHGTVEQYFQDKLRLFHVKRAGVHILNATDENSRRFGLSGDLWFMHPAGYHGAGDRVFRERREVGRIMNPVLGGVHNLANLCAALTAVDHLGYDPVAAFSSIETFSGLPHRQQVVGTANGIRFIDDSIATIPEATLAAVDRFGDRSLILLMGGFERHHNYDSFFDRIAESAAVKAVITMPENGHRIAAGLRAKLPGRSRPAVLEADDLPAAVAAAIGLARPGDAVLLSPAAPSYGAFTDFTHRGRVFRRLCGFCASPHE